METGLDYLALFVPQGFVIYAVSALAGTLTRRRVVSTVLAVGAALGIQLLMHATETTVLIKNQVMMDPSSAAVYWVVMLGIAAVIGAQAVVSAMHDWRTWFERSIGAKEAMPGAEQPALVQ